MSGRKRLNSSLITTALLLLSVGTASAIDQVICVPWQGDPVKQHTIISGQNAQLKCVVKTDSTATRWYKWSFGDGTPDSAVATLSGTTKYNLMIDSHAYTGATGTPLTATLLVDKIDNSMANAVSGNYLMKIENDNLDSKINISIDKGLWWLYTNAFSNNPVYGSNWNNWTQTYDGSTAMTWLQTSYEYSLAAPTASAIQAFGINNHKISGDPNKDPYVEAVKFGMNYLVKGYLYYTSWPALTASTIGTIHGSDNPEEGQTAPNGYGVYVYDYNGVRPIYQGGQIMDAIITAGVLPTDLTGRDFTKQSEDVSSKNWTYGELLQDMADMYAWGQSDDTCGGTGYCGSWWYGWNYSSGDNSASQWAAIGMIPAQQAPWNIKVPNWVKSYNINWLNRSFYNNQYFSYNMGNSCNDGCLNTTPSGMVQMAFAGQVGYDDPLTLADERDAKWQGSEKFMADNWGPLLDSCSTSWGGCYRTYGWFAIAKAMRLAVPKPIEKITKSDSTSFDWYRGDASNKGLATRIVETQNSAGYWTAALTDTPLTTAWNVITLRPALFDAAPIACFTANPNPTYALADVHFDPSCSGHSATGKTIANLTKFEWDFGDGTTSIKTTPEIVTHPYACAVLPCSYNAKLKVTDDSGQSLNATTVVTVKITNPPHPPVAKAGGPYTASLCTGDTLVLDGSKSFHPDAGQHEAGCSTCPDAVITNWDWDLVAPLNFAAINATGEKTANVLSFFTAPGSYDIGLRVTDNALLAFPTGTTANATDANFSKVNVSNGCICGIIAAAKSGIVQLKWTGLTGSQTYDIQRSTEGHNSGFTTIATNFTTLYQAYQDTTVVNGTTYYYRVVVKSQNSCMSKSVVAKPVAIVR